MTVSFFLRLVYALCLLMINTGLHGKAKAARQKAGGSSHLKTFLFFFGEEGILIREGNYETESVQMDATLTMPSSAAS